MEFLLRFDFWLLVAGIVVIGYQLCVILAAEQGRKHDLVKKLYKANQDYHLSVLIPYLDPNDHAHMLALLQALDEQEYPASKVTVQLALTEQTKATLFPEVLRANVKVWQYPDGMPRHEQAVSWLIERCLAAGGNGLFVFLRPTDMVKPDFFQNIVARGFDSFAIQGYVALKNAPETPLAKVIAVSSRLINRISNAGRYHMGMSCRLLDSGWAVKQEVLEMIPYRRGFDNDNLEYTICLNLENFRVNWAPNVTVYADADASYLPHMTRVTGTFFNRVNLLMKYGPKLLTRTLTRFDLNYLEQVLAIVKPPNFMIGFVLFAITLMAYTQPQTVPGQPVIWAGISVGVLLLQILTMAVARSRGADYAVMFLYTPMIYLLGIVTAPVALFNYATTVLNKNDDKRTYRKAKTTRFNEEMEAAPDLYRQKPLPGVLDGLESGSMHAYHEDGMESERQYTKVHASPPATTMNRVTEAEQPTATSSRMKLPREQVKAVPLSNGKKQVQCLLKTLTTFTEEGGELYQLTLEYKSMAFSTSTYRILDQAFYELQTKLMGRGLTVVTCGSCGYFFNPTADVPGALKNAGVCLFGKTGKEVNLNTDAVTVLSQACPYHCPLEQRETIVRQWKESLTPTLNPGRSK